MLAAALDAHFSAYDMPVQHVSDCWREWCEIHQRPPHHDELRLLAQAQIMRIGATPDAPVLIADTTPLMTAVYSQLRFNDHSLDSLALDHQAMFDITLLTGLDVDGQQGDGANERDTVDQTVRRLLNQGHLPFQVVYGSGKQRLENALFCIGQRAPEWAKKWGRREQTARWRGPCETCGDGACEHLLFTALLKP